MSEVRVGIYFKSVSRILKDGISPKYTVEYSHPMHNRLGVLTLDDLAEDAAREAPADQ